ncbi:beta-1,6-N-acetylglucosaminyltransferase [Sphingomonas sp. ZT3P38]|uniref:beta-1,6-N-acetylglucosaminyltransferase n=1 Tax=Parasphingomonas zepuensis TaxID=3096161 RepID=UPI002FCAA95A
MKHAVAMTAYKDFAILHSSARKLIANGADVFVHIDKKSAYTSAQIAALRDEGCRVTQRYNIPWAGYDHLRAIVDLLDEIVGTGEEYRYVHIISGQDYPVRRFGDAEELWDGTIYMKVISRDAFPENVESRIANRSVLYRFQTLGRLWNIADKVSTFAQKALGLRRLNLPSETPLFKGEIWLSLPYRACKDLLTRPESRMILSELRTTYISEEFYFQTLVMNSEYADRVTPRNLRYTDWKSGRGRPAFLDETDYEQILASGDIFARKISSDISSNLLTLLERNDPSRFMTERVAQNF